MEDYNCVLKIYITKIILRAVHFLAGSGPWGVVWKLPSYGLEDNSCTIL